MDFSSLKAKRDILAKRNNNSQEKEFEFCFYDLLNSMVTIIDTFDTNVRKWDFTGDIKQLLAKSKDFVRDLEGHLKFLEGK